MTQHQPHTGIVTAKQANFCQVRLATGPTVLCTKRARLKKTGQQVWVGDRVTVEDLDFTTSQGVITAVEPRKTLLNRPPVANASQLLLVFAIAEPELDPWQLSRFLLNVEATPLKSLLCFNKCDLISPQHQAQWQERLNQWGYPSILLSVHQHQGYDQLFPHLAGEITLLAGPSGVGKSSLIQSLIPAVEIRTAAVSGKLQRGRHTTRHVELYELPGQGWLADSPGFNKPTLHCAPAELASYFPEIRQRLGQGDCQFKDCRHRDEPHCVVRGDWERYDHYLELLTEVTDAYATRRDRPDQEQKLKRKMGTAGQETYEPRLETKKYRRRSRRLRHQTLEQWQLPEDLAQFDE